MRRHLQRSAAPRYVSRVLRLATVLAFLSLWGISEGEIIDNPGVSDSPRILSEKRTEIVEERNTHQRVWQIVRQVETIHPTTKQAETEEVASQIVEVGNGLCYKNQNDQWLVSDPTWRPTPDGFIMDTAGYKLEIGKTAGSWLHYTVQGDTTFLRASTIMASDGFQSITLSTLNPVHRRTDSYDRSKSIGIPAGIRARYRSGDPGDPRRIPSECDFPQEAIVSQSVRSQEDQGHHPYGDPNRQ